MERWFAFQEVPIFTEENLHLLFKVSRELWVPWPYIMKFKFNLKNISYEKFEKSIDLVKRGLKNVILHFNSSHGIIILELKNKKAAITDIILSYGEKIGEIEEEVFVPADFGFEEADFKDETEFWIKSLGSLDEAYLEEAIISLGEIGDKRAIPYLEKFLENESKSLQKLSRKSIESIKRKGNQN